MELIAKTSILYKAHLYSAGDALPQNNPEMVKAWKDAGTAEYKSVSSVSESDTDETKEQNDETKEPNTKTPKSMPEKTPKEPAQSASKKTATTVRKAASTVKKK